MDSFGNCGTDGDISGKTTADYEKAWIGYHDYSCAGSLYRSNLSAWQQDMERGFVADRQLSGDV